MSKKSKAAGAIVSIEVMAKHAKWRGGRYWEAGAVKFEGKELEALGTPEQIDALLDALDGDPHFTVKVDPPRVEA